MKVQLLMHLFLDFLYMCVCEYVYFFSKENQSPLFLFYGYSWQTKSKQTKNSMLWVEFLLVTSL